MAMSNNGAVRMRGKIHAEHSLDNSDMIQCINHGSPCAAPWEHRVAMPPSTRKSSLRVFSQHHGTGGSNHNQNALFAHLFPILPKKWLPNLIRFNLHLNFSAIRPTA